METIKKLEEDINECPYEGCKECFPKTIQLQILQEILKLIENNFKKCQVGLVDIQSQKSRENNQPIFWEQRMDELVLLYSSIVGISFLDANKKLLSKTNGRDSEGRRD